MPLRDKCVLVVDRGDKGTAEFHIRKNLTGESILEKVPIVGGAGENLRGLIGVITGEPAAAEGFEIDLGAGTATVELRAELGESGDQWGVPNPSSSELSAAESTQLDVSGGSVQTRAQFWQWWLRSASTDSRGGCKLYYGEWTDGTYANSAGIFERPADMSIRNVSSSPYGDNTDGARREVSVTLKHIEAVGSGPDSDPTPDN